MNFPTSWRRRSANPRSGSCRTHWPGSSILAWCSSAARRQTAVYIFKHALVQDAAYSTLLRSDRQRLHARIAEAVEGRFPDRVAREPELLAHHFTEAWQN